MYNIQVEVETQGRKVSKVHFFLVYSLQQIIAHLFMFSHGEDS